MSSPAPDALAALRRRATATGDAALIAALADAERAYQTLALERATLQSRLAAVATNAERELAKLRTLGRVAETVNSSLELEVVLRSVLDTAVEVLQAERGFLMIADAGNNLQLTTTYGIDRATVEGDDMRPSQTTVRRVFETGEPVVTTDAQQDPRFNVNLSVRALKLRSIICVPRWNRCRARCRPTCSVMSTTGGCTSRSCAARQSTASAAWRAARTAKSPRLSHRSRRRLRRCPRKRLSRRNPSCDPCSARYC